MTHAPTAIPSALVIGRLARNIRGPTSVFGNLAVFFLDARRAVLAQPGPIPPVLPFSGEFGIPRLRDGADECVFNARILAHSSLRAKPVVEFTPVACSELVDGRDAKLI